MTVPVLLLRKKSYYKKIKKLRSFIGGKRKDIEGSGRF